MIQYKRDTLTVKVYESRNSMGVSAAREIAACIKKLLEEKESINMLFAAAPSQNEMLAALAADPSIRWEKINAFHMDEYVGISRNAPQGFANFLKKALFDKVTFASVNLLDCTAEPCKEAERYSALLLKNPLDIVCMGIGENGHIAFNDPHVADFDDPALVKIVDLDEVCRMQQVHDGCFAALEDVPKYALTLTVPALHNAKYHFCVVPAATKAEAVKNMVEGEIGEKCPATILRQTENAVLYCDADSGALLSAPFEVGFITDEVSQNLDEAIDFARAFGIRNIELRSVEGLSPYEYTDDLVQKIKQQCDTAGIKICAISAPLFKCDYADREEREAQIRSFEQLVKRAKILGADLLRGFDFWASGVPVDKRAEAYKPILEICKKYSVRLALEYDPSVHASTPEKLEELLSEINDPIATALYDPGNGAYADADDIPYPNGYEILRSHISHIHVKDTLIHDGKPVCVSVGNGSVDYAGLFKRLYQDGYTGCVMLETHYRKKCELTEEQMKRPGGYGFSEGAYDASKESMESLIELIKTAGKEALK